MKLSGTARPTGCCVARTVQSNSLQLQAVTQTWLQNGREATSISRIICCHIEVLRVLIKRECALTLDQARTSAHTAVPRLRTCAGRGPMPAKTQSAASIKVLEARMTNCECHLAASLTRRLWRWSEVKR
jgi:hypothetical protein